ncbi:MAG: hypothetical protein ABWZ40_01030 [Caulobacterales bacterium]
MDPLNFASGAGAVAADADDFVLYDTTTNTLYYDDDGSGANAAQAIAHLQTGAALTAGDFVLL